MPANLPPQYHEAEQRYREAKTPQEKIEALEEMLAIIPKHKGTEHLIGDLRRRIAKHKAEAQKKGGPRRGSSIFVEREGAGQVVLVGPPNAGKSTIVGLLTNAKVEVAEYPFTTRKPVAGIMPFENIQIQLVDLPPISTEYMEL
ncbi:MAG: GTPase, partial [Candidatus Methylomirabilales bacterium]